MSDKRFEIAPPDRDGRRCVCEWLEITREGERHVFEYFREYTPAPEAASADEQFVAADVGVSVESVREAFAEPAATPSDAVSAHVSEVRSNPGNENGAWCEICCATLVCPSCGNHRSEPASATQTRLCRHGYLEPGQCSCFPDPARPSDAVKRDVVMKACLAYRAAQNGFPGDYQMTAALHTFAEALRDEARRELVLRNYVQHGTVAAIAPDLFDKVLAQAISNLLPEVTP